jgi:hypothetical protein
VGTETSYLTKSHDINYFSAPSFETYIGVHISIKVYQENICIRAGYINVVPGNEQTINVFSFQLGSSHDQSKF